MQPPPILSLPGEEPGGTEMQSHPTLVLPGEDTELEGVDNVFWIWFTGDIGLRAGELVIMERACGL